MIRTDECATGDYGEKYVHYILYDWKSGKKATDSRYSDQLKLYAYKILSKIKNPNLEQLKFHAYEVF